MRRAVLVGLAVLAVAFGMGAAATHDLTISPEPMLKIELPNGHGSGFHVGGGYVFTAAHVVKGEAKVEVLASDGQKDTAEVLWVNEKRDVALLRMEKLRTKSARLSCVVPTAGDAVEARGNPTNLTFISTWGQVAGKALSVGPWEKVVPVSMTIVPGQSGGPLYDRAGRVVGMNVGVMVVPLGFGGSLVGIGYSVPGSTLCELLAKV